MNKIKPHIAYAFHYARTYKKISQRAMATRLWVNQSTISRIERGTIIPRKRTVDKLLLLMDQSLEELITTALEARELMERMQQSKKEAVAPPEEVRYENLGTADQLYLQYKWQVMVADMDRSMGRKFYRHGQRVKKLRKEQQRVSHFTHHTEKERDLLDYLQNSGMEEEMMNRRANRLAVWADLGSRLQLNSTRKSPVELVLEKARLEELRMIRDYRASVLSQMQSGQTHQNFFHAI
ncbi:MAG: helix-turn-helix transcriptional regulator [Cyclobacteriaceae bacterium]